jgi:hypothetical protein
MTAGVPGTGLGGLFYILAALLLPVRGALRKLRGLSVDWNEIVKLTGLAVGVFLGIWLTGWLLGLLLAPTARTLEAAAGVTAALRAKSENILRWAAVVAGFVTLAFVLLAVQAARLLDRRRKADD